MNEILKKEMQRNKNKEIIIFLKNNFRYKGKVVDCDDKAVKIIDRKYGSMLIAFDNISSSIMLERDDKNGN